MRVAVLHFHYKPGGVTRVVCHAVESLETHPVESILIAGEIPVDFPQDFTSMEYPALGYADECTGNPVDVVDDLIRETTRLLGSKPDLWHIHNHSLGKNQLTHRVVGELARRGCPLLLQIHDFAEDGRLPNILRLKAAEGFDKLYPQGEHVHYGILNGRDKNLLLDAGFPESHVHFIPNPVQVNLDTPRPLDLNADRYFLYPTRAIRRKNIGEVLLWAAAAEEGDRFGLTLAPDNPEARIFYEHWVSLAETLSLPVDFEMGRQHGFSDLLHATDWIITTSVAEGFGLAFLEPGLIPRPVTGRDLPEITQDFKQEGVSLSHLYSSIPIPLDCLDQQVLRTDIIHTVKELYQAYELEFTESVQNDYLETLLGGDTIDFGILSERDQTQIIKKVKEGEKLLPVSPWSEGANEQQLKSDQILIKDRYDRSAYGKRLHELYQHIVHSETTPDLQWISPDRLIQAFLTPSRFNFLRV